MVTSTDIATKVRNRVANIPSSITDAMVLEYVSDSIIEVQNLTGDSISSSAVDTKYQAVLTDMGAIKVMRFMIQPTFSLGGELTINRAEMLRLVEDMEKRVSEQLDDVIRFSSTGGIQTTEPELNF